MNICLLLLKDWLVWTRSLSSRTIWTWQGKCERWPNSWLLREIKWFILGYRSHSATNKTHGINKQIHWLNTCVWVHLLRSALFVLGIVSIQDRTKYNVRECEWMLLEMHEFISHTDTASSLALHVATAWHGQQWPTHHRPLCLKTTDAPIWPQLVDLRW